jgi:hypothetical protein
VSRIAAADRTAGFRSFLPSREKLSSDQAAHRTRLRRVGDLRRSAGVRSRSEQQIAEIAEGHGCSAIGGRRSTPSFSASSALERAPWTARWVGYRATNGENCGVRSAECGVRAAARIAAGERIAGPRSFVPACVSVKGPVRAAWPFPAICPRNPPRRF